MLNRAIPGSAEHAKQMGQHKKDEPPKQKISPSVEVKSGLLRSQQQEELQAGDEAAGRGRVDMEVDKKKKRPNTKLWFRISMNRITTDVSGVLKL